MLNKCPAIKLIFNLLLASIRITPHIREKITPKLQSVVDIVRIASTFGDAVGFPTKI